MQNQKIRSLEWKDTTSDEYINEKGMYLVQLFW